MPNLPLPARNKFDAATLNLAGSKSIANRVLLLASIANGTSKISNVPNDCEDVKLMLQALKQLGVKITLLETDHKFKSSSYAIEGGNRGFSNSEIDIFCENSGTCMRFLTAILALQAQHQNYTITGIQRMKQRPITDLVNSLNQIGADIKYLENLGFPPLQVNKFNYNNTKLINLSGKISSQYLTGILMAIASQSLDITIHIYDELISKPYVNITTELLAKFGAEIIINGANYTNVPSKLQAISYTIEPDASSASYFLALGCLQGSITINNLSNTSIQGDKDFAKVLQRMGANVSYSDNYIMISKAHKLKAIHINMQDMPDAAMTLAVVCLFATGTSTITGISSWQYKETDRLQAMYNELSKLGATVSLTNDSITILPPKIINSNVTIDTYNDHRIAMAFSLVAGAGIAITINDYQCVNKTFANYFDLFNQCCYS